MFPSRLKLAGYALVVLIGCLIAAPNLFTAQQLGLLPTWLPKPQVALGLDLRGGSQLVLAVDAADLARERLTAIAADARTALRQSGVSGAVVTMSGDAVVVRAAAAKQAATEAALRGLVSTAPDTSQPDIEISRGPDSAFLLRPTATSLGARLDRAIEQSVPIVERRINEFGVAEPTVQRLGADRILVQLPGVKNPDEIKKRLGTTAKMAFHLVATKLEPSALQGGSLPAGVIMAPAAKGGMRYPIEAEPLLQGDRLVDAAMAFDQRSGQPIVTFKLDSIGAKQFAGITRAHVGEPFAILLDGKVLSAPVIREPITAGAGEISGGFAAEEASSLAALLRAGSLPVAFTVAEERTVGPDLGADMIRMGAITGVAGFALVLGFMVALYGRWGLVASAALAVNVVLTFAGLSLFGATLTLPGIAGIVLGIGLAVDANVLINERIKEEARRGRSAAAALDYGFQRAYRTIVDSNVTTLIATLLLFWFGSGPVRGFAVTMGLGIVTSMFTAVAIVRAVMAVWVRRRRPKQFAIEPLLRLNLLPAESSIRFMRARFLGIAVSMLLSVASVTLFITPGLNYGIDFAGGTIVEATTPQPADLAALRSTLDGLQLGDVALQEAGNASTLLLRIERQAGGDAAQQAAADRVKRAVEAVAPGTHFERVEVVGPTISGELKRTGVIAVALASLAMLAYIWVRFEWQFAVGAIATLVLDVTKTVGFLALTGLDFNLTAIAAVLTLIGYSVNDKVVVYDRMRENLRLHPQMPLRQLIDLSINQTFMRSLYTSATAFLALLPMALWGGPAVASFAWPMLFGIAVAASSSIFIAAPILLFLGERRWRRKGVGAVGQVPALAGTARK
ncbi:MAG TPA: protein translocase subunit SecD [Candidatus Acidoferrum sp.]|nr:protein translocase subunit SecD [Candidatus Acidoferrum sp.]